MKIYAGIGSRKTPQEILDLMFQIGAKLAFYGYQLNTGAAPGADQAFANGANSISGKINLCLPWWSYEQAWINTLANCTKTIYNEKIHINAKQSVYMYHPKAFQLTQGVFKLHARNFLILQGISSVICWTPNAEMVGGTGQALRIIVRDIGIKIYNLASTYDLDFVRKELNL